MTTLKRNRDVLPSDRFKLRQGLHFGISFVIPTLLAVSLPPFLPDAWMSPAGIAIGLLMWLLVGGFGVSVGLHRYFSHRSFKATPAVRILLGVCGSMAVQGSVTYWVAIHRRHHACSDEPGDPHSPHARAQADSQRISPFLHGHLGWTLRHDVPKPTRYARDLLDDPVVRWLSQHYWKWVVLGLLLPALIGGLAFRSWQGAIIGLYWGGIVRIAVGHQIIWAINSVCHVWGARPHLVDNFSTNSALLALPSWGESWHNNHHHQPAAARFGEQWWQIDIGWWLIRGLAVLGGASEIRNRRGLAHGDLITALPADES